MIKRTATLSVLSIITCATASSISSTKASAGCFSACFRWFCRLFSRNSFNGSHTGDATVIANRAVSSLDLNGTDTSTTYQIPKPTIKSSTPSSSSHKNKKVAFSAATKVTEFDKTAPSEKVLYGPTYYVSSYDWYNE